MYNVVQKLNLVVHLMHSYHTVFFKTVLIYLRVGLGYLKALRQNLNSRQNLCFRVFLGNANYVQVQSNALWIHSKICRWNIKKSHSWARRLGAAIKNHLKKWVEYKQQIYYCLRWQEDIVRILFSSRFIIRVIPTKFLLPTVFLMIKITVF